jgi:ABC-type thiamin/hydroxymethylpyrimidine transport system permease subunit/DMSO/TMAO reductase YedYZ molybdopterin-dependent catalytic subunit
MASPFRDAFFVAWSLSERKEMSQRKYYFSTRDLLMMAALAALGGVVSTYVNAIGDFFQSILGFAGTTQWAAGLHVLWLTLAVGLTGKQGAGTITGILKGAVELLSGNTHGLLVVLVDIVAGLLVDLGFLPFRNKDSLPAYALAGGLASASNVFVFQLFASLPADVLAYGAMLLIGGVAFVSGVLFAGLLGQVLLNALRRAGVVKDRQPVPMNRRMYPIFLAGAAVLTLALGAYLRQALRGPAAVHVGGTVQTPYDYPAEHGDIPLTTAEGTLRDVTTRYTGVPVRELLDRAQPPPDASLLLIRASDGYAFFVSMDEVQENTSLLLAPQDEGKDASYNIVGAHNSKAWVRGVKELVVIGSANLEVNGALENPSPYDPNDWQFEMDSTLLDVGEGPKKYQGVPLGKVLQAMEPRPGAATVVLHADGEPASMPLADVMGDDDLRLFTIIGEAEVSFAVARMNGEVVAARVTRIEVR